MTNNIESAGDERMSTMARLVRPSNLSDAFLNGLQFVLVCYALLGRGFAGTAIGPIYIGDVFLIFGVLATLFSPAWARVLSLRVVWLLLAFLAWGAIRTIPYVSVYGRDALRDGAMWGYGALALLVSVICISRPHRIERLIENYRGYVMLFATLGTIGFLTTILDTSVLPSFPGSRFPIVSLRSGEVMVQAAGVMTFIIVGMRRSWVPILLMTPIFALAVVSSRAALLALLSALAVLMLLGQNRFKTWSIFGGFGISVIVVLSILSVTRISLPFSDRTLTADQLLDNFSSIFNSPDQVSLENTKSWRLYWWDQIIEDTFTPQYFLAGKGFGYNLTNALPVEGYEGYDDEQALRSPHNFHLNILARAGVIGFALWTALQISWATAIYQSHRRAVVLRLRQWQQFFLWLLAWWVAFIVNATFDVFLEGPMGSMWFWSVFGLGLSGVWVFEHHRDEIFHQ